MARRGENIYKRRDGRWEGRYRVGSNPNGKPKYRSIYGHSYREVKEKLTVEKLKFRITPTSAGKVTVKALFVEWMQAVQLRVKPSTFANYRMKIEKYLLPEFGGFRYEEITAEQMHRFILKLCSMIKA